MISHEWRKASLPDTIRISVNAQFPLVLVIYTRVEHFPSFGGINSVSRNSLDFMFEIIMEAGGRRSKSTKGDLLLSQQLVSANQLPVKMDTRFNFIDQKSP